MINEQISKTLERMEALSEKQLFFVLGMPRSGTTWLQKALDSHNEIKCLGESHFADILLPLLQKSFQGFNKRVVQQGGVVAHLRKYGGHVPTLTYDSNDVHLLLYHCMYVIFDKWVDSPVVRIIGEKTPDTIRSLNLLSAIFPSARFVHILRDGRDSAVSAWFFNNSGLDKNKVVTQSFESFISGFVKQWKTQVDFARRIGANLNGRYLELSFEDLLVDTHEQLGTTFRFLGASDSHEQIRECVDNTTFQVLSSGRQPGEENVDSFFRQGTAGDWRRHLDDELSTRAWGIAGDTLAALGYKRH